MRQGRAIGIIAAVGLLSLIGYGLYKMPNAGEAKIDKLLAKVESGDTVTETTVDSATASPTPTVAKPVAKKKVRRPTVNDRLAYAYKLEREFFLELLKMDVDVRATGEERRDLEINYVLMGRVLANELSKSDFLVSTAKTEGFTRIRFRQCRAGESAREEYTYTLTEGQ